MKLDQATEISGERIRLDVDLALGVLDETVYSPDGVTLRFRGREMAHRELGAAMLKRVETELGDLITVEQYPRMEGRQMVMMIAPKKH